MDDIVCSIFVTIFILSACGVPTIDTFSGESAHWTATFEQNATKEHATKKLIIQYKGDVSELATVDKIHYQFNSRQFGMESSIDVQENEHFQKSGIYTDGYSSTPQFISEDTPMDIIIKWDGQEEQFDLIYKK